MKQHGVRRIATLVTAASCLLLPGCGDANQPIEPERITQLDVDFTFSQEVPQTVAVYKAECMRLQDSQLYQDLLGGPAAETEVHAQGVTSYSEPDENGRRVFLDLNDNGNAFGNPYGKEATGLFTYQLMENDAYLESKYSQVGLFCSREKYASIQEDEYASYLFGEEEDLSFATRQEVQDAIIEQFAQWDVTLAPANCYSYSLEALEQVAAAYEKSEGIAVDFTRQDECYGLSFWQMIDGIPAVDVAWKKGNTVPRELLGQKKTSLDVIVNAEGTISMEGKSFLTVGDKQGEIRVIDGETALGALDTYYENMADLENLRVTEGLLMYGAFFPNENEDDLFLQPVWVFTVQYDKAEEIHDGHSNKTGQTVLLHCTDYMAVNGETGEVWECAYLSW
ncbi:MAG: hypothetical protein DBX97_04335 [Collinsella tanakaei]|nr:MAG: hypothetical protein DBX97_04335 [Collinsella tanakaei]